MTGVTGRDWPLSLGEAVSEGKKYKMVSTTPSLREQVKLPHHNTITWNSIRETLVENKNKIDSLPGLVSLLSAVSPAYYRPHRNRVTGKLTAPRMRGLEGYLRLCNKHYFFRTLIPFIIDLILDCERVFPTSFDFPLLVEDTQQSVHLTR